MNQSNTKIIICWVLCCLFLAMIPSSTLANQNVVVIPLNSGVKSTLSSDWKGEWGEDVIYSKGAVVQYNGNTYICVTAHTSSLSEDPAASSFWSLMVAKGDKGDTGPQGPQGDPGVIAAQICPGRSLVQGIDAEGNLICNDKIIFVSSTLYAGGSALNGITNATAICTTLASNGGLSGKFKPWLSDSTQSPDTTFAKVSGTYVNTNGDVIAYDYNDLIDGTLLNKVKYDEYGNIKTSYNVFTGTKPNGTASGYHCGDWTSTSGFVTLGNPDLSTTAWTEIDTTPNSSCASTARIYCVEQ